MSDQRVVALLGVGVVPADTPILRADDLGALRGDGIFETMHVRDGRAWLLDEHLDRMAALGRPDGPGPAAARGAGRTGRHRRWRRWPTAVEGGAAAGLHPWRRRTAAT